ncbi:MAG: hypothetical protein N2111_14640, partial [Candidatus Sumerlaeaceae bacterium]|nr:hypothetical protein [Candidatus Sumerlaeaceae bacterium]
VFNKLARQSWVLRGISDQDLSKAWPPNYLFSILESERLDWTQVMSARLQRDITSTGTRLRVDGETPRKGATRSREWWFDQHGLLRVLRMSGTFDSGDVASWERTLFFEDYHADPLFPKRCVISGHRVLNPKNKARIVTADEVHFDSIEAAKSVEDLKALLSIRVGDQFVDKRSGAVWNVTRNGWPDEAEFLRQAQMAAREKQRFRHATKWLGMLASWQGLVASTVAVCILLTVMLVRRGRRSQVAGRKPSRLRR